MYNPKTAFPQISITEVGGGDWELKTNDTTYKLPIAYRGHHCRSARLICNSSAKW